MTIFFFFFRLSQPFYALPTSERENGERREFIQDKFLDFNSFKRNQVFLKENMERIFCSYISLIDCSEISPLNKQKYKICR